MRDISLDLGIVADIHQTLLVVDLGGLGLVVLDGRFLVAQNVADRLHDGPMLDQTGRARGQQRGEEEKVARGDDDDIVVFRVELFQQRDGFKRDKVCRLN